MRGKALEKFWREKRKKSRSGVNSNIQENCGENELFYCECEFLVSIIVMEHNYDIFPMSRIAHIVYSE